MGIFRRRENTDTAPAGGRDALLAETIARHFDGAVAQGGTVLGAAGLRIDCHVDSVQKAAGGIRAAAIYLQLSGQHLGPTPVFASISGYEGSEEASIVEGACSWACTFGPVLEAAGVDAAIALDDVRGLPEWTGTIPPTTGGDEIHNLQRRDVVVGGRRYRAWFAALDRLLTATQPEPGLTRGARARLGGSPWLTPTLLASGTLPPLAPDQATVVSTFVMEAGPARSVEVKVQGQDWAASGPVFAAAPAGRASGAAILLRELAVLVPLPPAPPVTRASVEAALAGMAAHTACDEVAGWQGWRAHGGVLGEPLPEAALAGVESVAGRLPEDFRTFLTTVAGPGAGPGYGLLEPQVVGGVVPLAVAGCGVVWVLRLDEGHRGEVFADSRVVDDGYRKVADTFTGWWSDWQGESVRFLGAPWVQWDASVCGATKALAHVMQNAGDDVPHDQDTGLPVLTGRVPDGALSIVSGGGGMISAGVTLEPCQYCATFAAKLGLPPSVFAEAGVTAEVSRA